MGDKGISLLELVGKVVVNLFLALMITIVMLALITMLIGVPIGLGIAIVESIVK